MKSTTFAPGRKQTVAKPFLKWAGGKGQLLEEIETRLPEQLRTGEIDTYVEPFVGGGAVFFLLAQKYPSLRHFYLFDINQDLVNCYKVVKKSADALIQQLNKIEKQYMSLEQPDRRDLFLQIRQKFNEEKLIQFNVSTAAELIFLNKTCYNGLYRVNRKGEFNVPFGDYKNPNICDSDNLLAVSRLLKAAEIICADFEESEKYVDDHTFVYLDPPYRPLSATASFTSYSKYDFTERDQMRLAGFCVRIAAKGARFLLSNSDPKNEDPTDGFFETCYGDFNIERIRAIRAINCKGSRRGEISELLITNCAHKRKLLRTTCLRRSIDGRVPL